MVFRSEQGFVEKGQPGPAFGGAKLYAMPVGKSIKTRLFMLVVVGV